MVCLAVPWDEPAWRLKFWRYTGKILNKSSQKLEFRRNLWMNQGKFLMEPQEKPMPNSWKEPQECFKNVQDETFKKFRILILREYLNNPRKNSGWITRNSIEVRKKRSLEEPRKTFMVDSRENLPRNLRKYPWRKNFGKNDGENL